MGTAAPDGPPPSHPETRPDKHTDALTRFRRRLLVHLSIRQRLALWYATLLALTLVLFSVIVYTVAQNQLQTSVNEEIRGRAVYIAAALQGQQDSVGQPASATVTISPSPSRTAAPTATATATVAPTQSASPNTTP